MKDRQEIWALTRWLNLACMVIWLINFVLRLSNYFRRLGRGVPLEQLADVQFDCVATGFITVIWLFVFSVWRMDPKKPVAWLVRLIFLAVIFAGWAATYSLMTASGFPRTFWWLILAVVLSATVFFGWKYRSVKRQMKSHIQDEMI